MRPNLRYQNSHDCQVYDKKKSHKQVGSKIQNQHKKAKIYFQFNFNTAYCIGSTRKKHIFLLVSRGEEEIFMA